MRWRCATTAGASRSARSSTASAKINTGGKYNDDVFQFSVGLNGVGTKAVNALSSEFEVVSSWRDGKLQAGRFAAGDR
jgi:topoisomerase IV subunit B